MEAFPEESIDLIGILYSSILHRTRDFYCRLYLLNYPGLKNCNQPWMNFDSPKIFNPAALYLVQPHSHVVHTLTKGLLHDQQWESNPDPLDLGPYTILSELPLIQSIEFSSKFSSR